MWGYRARDVSRMLDLPLGEIPRANASTPRGPYQDFYTDVTRAKVGAVFADDVTAFGYTF